MTSPHLDPADIELLVDDEQAPGAAALAAHAAGCDQCRTALDEARFVAEMLTTAPHHKPTRDFSDRVMGSVEVSSPWHVAVSNTVRAAVPDPGVPRTAMLVGAICAGIVSTAGVVFVALRADQAAVVAGLAASRLGTAALRLSHDIAGSVLGPAATDLLDTHGLKAVALAIPAFLLTSGVALAGFHALGASARARRG